MRFYAEKKAEHEQAVEKALGEKDYRAASRHTAKAAEFGLKLAETHDGKIAKRYLEDAAALIEYAEKLKRKWQKQQQEKGEDRRLAQESEGDAKDGGDRETSRFQVDKKPDVRLDDVAGLDEVKRVLRDNIIRPFEHPEVYDRFGIKGGAGVLLYGPPGNGKTFIAKAIAGELDAAFFNIVLSEMKNKYVGETEKNISALFAEARKQERVVLFLDECESLLRKRGNQKVAAVESFLAETDGLQENENLMLLLLATNRPWMMDPAVTRPGRIGVHIYVGLPDKAARAAIISYAMRGVPLGRDVDIDALAERTEGYSGAEIGANAPGSVCREAKQTAASRQMATVDAARQDGDKIPLTEEVTMADFEAALAKIKPQTSEDELDQFIQWRGSHAEVPGVGGPEDDGQQD